MQHRPLARPAGNVRGLARTNNIGQTSRNDNNNKPWRNKPYGHDASRSQWQDLVISRVWEATTWNIVVRQVALPALQWDCTT